MKQPKDWKENFFPVLFLKNLNAMILPYFCHKCALYC